MGKKCAMCGHEAEGDELRPHLAAQHPGFLSPADQARFGPARTERHDAYLTAQKTCPLPIVEALQALPGGLELFPDEFLVSIAKDWGWSSQKLTLTTHRVIYSRGRLAKDQQVVYLADIRDVRFHKPLMGFGTLALETAGGHSVEGLPAASGGQAVRDQLLQLVHFARQRAAPVTQVITTAAPVPDKFDQLKKLAELKHLGAITDAEFETEKAKLLQ